jgi:hypothetical protein
MILGVSMDCKTFKKYFEYKDGKLYWKVDKGSIKAGKIAGSVNNTTGYWEVTLNKRRYQAHRVIWCLHQDDNYRVDFKEQVDHINMVKCDNRIENLRLCTKAQNQYNTGLRVSNKSGHKGVSFCKSTGKWLAQARVDGKKINLGRYVDKGLANKVYTDFAKQHQKEFARV